MNLKAAKVGACDNVPARDLEGDIDLAVSNVGDIIITGCTCCTCAAGTAIVAVPTSDCCEGATKVTGCTGAAKVSVPIACQGAAKVSCAHGKACQLSLLTPLPMPETESGCNGAT